LGIGDWGLGPIPNPQSPIPSVNYLEILIFNKYYIILSILVYVIVENKTINKINNKIEVIIQIEVIK